MQRVNVEPQKKNRTEGKVYDMQAKVTFTNNNPDTIWNRLAAKLGREPTNEEAKVEVKRILAEGTKAAKEERAKR